MQANSIAAVEPISSASAPSETPPAKRPPNPAGLAALCLVARLHHIAADPVHLAHQLGWPPGHRPTPDDLLRAAHRLGL